MFFWTARRVVYRSEKQVSAVGENHFSTQVIVHLFSQTGSYPLLAHRHYHLFWGGFGGIRSALVRGAIRVLSRCFSTAATAWPFAWRGTRAVLLNGLQQFTWIRQAGDSQLGSNGWFSRVVQTAHELRSIFVLAGLGLDDGEFLSTVRSRIGPPNSINTCAVGTVS